MAATDACSFVDGLGKADFLEDKRTQQAVIMSLIIIGEAATKVMDGFAKFTQAHVEVPWRSMRNRIAHGYFDINLDVVWDALVVWKLDRLGRSVKQLVDLVGELHKQGVSVPTLYRWVPASAHT